MSRQYVVDVSSYQPTDLSEYAQAGATMAIVKLTQSINYHNPKAAGQLASAKANHMAIAGYFYANFGHSTSAALYEAQYCVAAAKNLKLPAGSYLAVDWESGSGNDTSINSTTAIISAMQAIKKAGYRPLLYSGAALLRTAVTTRAITQQFGNCLWVASYPTTDAVSAADMSYFPSMDGVALWQFTDNWKGKNVDASISVVDLSNDQTGVDEEMAWHPEVKYNELGRFKVNRKAAPLYADHYMHSKIGSRPYGTVYKVGRASDGMVECGTDQWFSQADGLTKINPLAVNINANAICKIVAKDAWTQNKPGIGQPGIKHLKPGECYKVFGRLGKYLIVGSEKVGKYIDADKCVIVL